NRYDRLTVQGEPVVRQRFIQTRDPMHAARALPDVPIHRIVYLQPVAPLLLGEVASGLGPAQQGGGRTRIEAERNEARAHVCMQAHAVPLETVAGDRRAQ